MKAKKLFWALLSVLTVFSVNVALSSCEKSDNTPSNDTENTGGGEEEDEPEPEDEPYVEPVKGKIRFLINAAGINACNGIALEGKFNDNSPTDNLAIGTLVEGSTVWYTIDIPAMTAEDFGNAKILILDKEGKSSWDYQISNYGYDISGSEDYITLIDDFGNQNAINLAKDDLDNVVIKVILLQANGTPCADAIPGGTAKFIFTMEGDCPAESIIFTGNFAELGWDKSDREMTKQEDGTYVWEGEYPENFKFKAIAIVGGAQVWLTGSDIPVKAEDGKEITFSGCFDKYCPVEETPAE